MQEERGHQVINLINKLVENIDRKHIRKMQVNMYKCAMECSADEFGTMDTVRNCVNNCISPVESAQKFIQGEVERATKRLDRCLLDCRDSLQDKIGDNATDDTVKKYMNDFEKCAGKCLDNHCNLLPTLEKSISEALSKRYPQ